MSKPIYGTDLERPMPDIIEDFRNQLSHTRGQMSDVSHKWPGWGERLKEIEGLLTCGLVYLAYIRDEATEHAKRWGLPPYDRRKADRRVTSNTIDGPHCRKDGYCTATDTLRGMGKDRRLEKKP